jgi:sugar phosphate isomerase/epimerase
MKKLGTKLIRIMSYAIKRDPTTWRVLPDSEQFFEERVRRLKEIVRLFLDAGINPVHENCMNYGGLSWKHSLRLIEAVPGLKLVFDTGNPPFSEDMSKKLSDGVETMQDSWEFYSHVKEHIAYIHIKDARGKAEMTNGAVFPSGQEFTFPGEGDGKVKEIVADLLRNAYDGGFSIEPHMKIVFHEENQTNKEDASFENYVEYGKRFMRIIEETKCGEKILRHY